MEEFNIDFEKLRQDLINYFGSASFIYPVAIMNVIEVETADYHKLIQIANNNGFNIDNYVICSNTRKLFK